MKSSSPTEKPLSGGARLALVSGAAAVILASYLFSIVAILLLLIIIGFELICVLALARFGLSGIMIKMMERHLRLLTVFFRSFRLGRNAEFRLSLQPNDAPRLFSMLEKLCRRLDVALPREVSLEMGVSAWVRMKGYRRGAGKTVLGIGYDLLAGLSEVEVEGVLAHEMVHAKLVQRGFRSWLFGGMGRLSTLAVALKAQAHAYRQIKQTFGLAEVSLAVADSLTRLAARLVATYSRQDEFDADRGAAEICGTAPVRSGLLKLEQLSEKVARLPWNERVAQLQGRESFSEWLRKELTCRTDWQPSRNDEVLNQYSTHPSLRDRVAALPDTSAVACIEGSPPAIEMLSKPDEVASKLMAEIQRVLAEQEKKDAKELRKLVRKLQRNTHIRPLRCFAFLLVAIGVIAVLSGVFAKSFIGAAVGVAVGGLGMFTFRRAKFKDRMDLPVPDYSLLKKWKPEQLKDIDVRQQEIENDLTRRITAENKKARKVHLLTKECYRALGETDYLRAHVAARLCYGLDKKSVEALLGLSVASAALRMPDNAMQALDAVIKLAGLKSPATTWGAGWATLMVGDWMHAEALLSEALRHRPNDSTLLALMSVAQSARGKSHNAIISARQACRPQPKNKEYAKLLINLLLDTGHWLQAREWLAPLKEHALDDTDVLLALVRLSLLERNMEAAERWTEALNQKSCAPYTSVKLAEAYELARKDEMASTLYRRALDNDFYPEAWMGLGRLARQVNKDDARRCFLSALNLDRTAAAGSAGPLPFFHQIINELLLLEDASPNCRAWVATFGANALPALANQSVMVYAATQSEAEQYLFRILKAMQPGSPPAAGWFKWRATRHDEHPIGPVRPGVQFAFS